MNKSIAFDKIRNTSPFWLIAAWSLLLLADFVNLIPQPASIIGYRWKVEFAFAGLIFLTLLAALKFPPNKISFINFSRTEIWWIILPLISFTAWSGLSLVWASSWRNALHHTLLWACYVIFYVLARQIVSRPRLLDACLKCAGAVITILGLACIVEYLGNFGKIDSSFTFRYYKYAEALATLLPIYFALALQLKSRRAFLCGVVLEIAWLVIQLSLSRTEFVAGSVAVGSFLVLLFVFQEWKRHAKKLILITSLLMLAVFVTQMSFLPTQNKSTVTRFTNDQHGQYTFKWRLLVWGMSLEAFKQKPLLGIGADNFVADYRTILEAYAVSDPNNPLLEIEEAIIPERAHNEYLQILSELGIVGAFFFGWFLFGIVRLAFLLRKKSTSLLPLAALAGLSAFFVSSIASSYSFRVPANGVCFFFVLALATGGLLKEEDEKTKTLLDFNRLKLKPLFIGFSCIICLALLIFSAVRGASLMYLQKSLVASETVETERNIRKAIALDDEEALFRYYHGVQLYNLKRSAEAIPQLRFGINKGIALSNSYFYLASAQIIARRFDDAEQTFVESLQVYPRSVFLRTAFSSFLSKSGKHSQSEIEYEKALQINPRQARSWQLAHAEGLEKLTLTEAKDDSFVKVMELKPTEAIFALSNFQRQTSPKLGQN